ncbi:MAG: hypothetical protein SOY60_05230 [Fusobacterium gastrosuis]|uniref:hypothetical protein n=1 Tax=Fusobacterium gastrosuis TaxID=1755100 RepID=UPI0029742321|nr:hypothetical protein [Fusobacteriaceae bacterium]MDY4011049.1 hypothetical protein [Fusobacterium gastrosuis]MDY5714119.1 hypothetical protein [Fusobacterium gastrosuis]
MNIFSFLAEVFIFSIIINVLILLFGKETLVIFVGFLLNIGALYFCRRIILNSTSDNFNSEVAEIIIFLSNIFCNWISIVVALIISIIFGIIIKIQKGEMSNK